MGDTIRVQGAQADIDAVVATAAVAYSTSSAEVLGTAVDSTVYPGKRIFAVFNHAADATSTGVTLTVKESDASGGSYTAATKPWIKTSMTPAGGSGVISATLLFMR